MAQFNQTIASIREGQLHVQLTDEMTELVAAVMKHGKSGSLTLTLKVRPDRGALFFDPSIKTALPKASVGGAMFFGDEDGNLFNRDPKQTDIDDFTKRRTGTDDKE